MSPLIEGARTAAVTYLNATVVGRGAEALKVPSSGGRFRRPVRPHTQHDDVQQDDAQHDGAQHDAPSGSRHRLPARPRKRSSDLRLLE